MIFHTHNNNNKNNKWS